MNDECRSVAVEQILIEVCPSSAQFERQTGRAALVCNKVRQVTKMLAGRVHRPVLVDSGV